MTPSPAPARTQEDTARIEQEPVPKGKSPLRLEGETNDITLAVRANRKRYGVLPKCRRCRRGCKQYDAPGLARLVCPRSPDYEDEAERLVL